MQTHTTIGADILQGIAQRHRAALGFLQMATDIARHHHERWDGKGFPDRLAGNDIPLAARILTICDVYDALVSPRVYRGAWPRERAIALLEEESGTAFDRRCVDAIMRVVGASGAGQPALAA